MIDPGTYPAVPVGHEFGWTSADKEQVAIAFRLDDGRTIVAYRYFSDKTWERTLEDLRICGMKGDDVSAIKPGDLSRPVSLVIIHEPDLDGVLQAKVRYINDPNEVRGLKKPMDRESLIAFAQRLKYRASGASDGPPSSVADGNDTPF